MTAQSNNPAKSANTKMGRNAVVFHRVCSVFAGPAFVSYGSMGAAARAMRCLGWLAFGVARKKGGDLDMAITRPRHDDVAFYKDMHRLIALHLKGNRRGGDRNAYRCVQRIAPLVGESVPPLSEFQEVKCQDLSPGGFSFLCDAPPIYEDYAVELGKPPVLIYVTAGIVHISEVRTGSRVQYLAGCRFTGRLRAD